MKNRFVAVVAGIVVFFLFDSCSGVADSIVYRPNVNNPQNTTAVGYTIIYNLNGGINTKNNVVNYSSGTVVTLEPATKTGYSFSGWYDNADFSGEAITQVSERSITLWAKWTAIEYSVSYVVTNGANDMLESITSHGVYTIEGTRIPIPQKDGYQFKGWFLDQGQTQLVTDFTGLTGDLILYGHWVGVIYSVEYRCIDEASISSGYMSVSGFSTEDTSLILPVYEKKYYKFDGWFKESSCSGNPVDKLTMADAAAGTNLILYAKWKEIEFEVKYDLLFSKGVSNLNSKTITVSSSIQNLIDPTPDDTNYIFDGWYKNLQNKDYSNKVAGVSVEDVTNNDHSITLYAKWKYITESSPYGMPVVKTSMQALPSEIEYLKNGKLEYYLYVDDPIITAEQIGVLNPLLSYGGNARFYLDFRAATDGFDMDGSLSYKKTFRGCVNIKGIVLPDNLTNIEKNAFKGCTSLVKIRIPDDVREIGESAFSGCSSLETLIIPSGVTQIGSSAFSGCKKLVNITIPNNITRICTHTFARCESLTELVIPDGVTEIDAWAFKECSRLTSITIPKDVAVLQNSVFDGCTGLESIEVDENNSNYKSIDGVLYDKEGKVLIRVPIAKSFSSFVIPETVVTIDSAFEGCKSIESITIPNGVTRIGWSAFAGCDKLTTIIIPDGVTVIGNDAFKDCVKLKSIKIPDGVSEISSGVFSGCRELSSITIPENVTRIGSGAFEGCWKITNLSIPAGVIKIDSSAFRYCGISEIILPVGIVSIGAYCFYGSAVSSVRIPDSVTRIEKYAFGDCSKLENINIPSGVKTIGEYAFWNCDKIKSIVIPEGVTDIEKYAFSKIGLETVVIPNSVSRIEEGTFFSCKNLSSVKIEDGVVSIGDDAFNQCDNLVAITIPASVEKIGKYVFFLCSSLKCITFEDTINNWYMTNKSSYAGGSKIGPMSVDAAANSSILVDNYTKYWYKVTGL